MPGKIAAAASEWVMVARSLLQLPDSQSLALRCMARAGLAARDDYAEWVAVARAWQQDFNDPAMARQCLHKAEACAAEIEAEEPWSAVTDAWVELGYYNNAVECQRKSHELGAPKQPASHWINRVRREIENDNNLAAQQYLARAEAVAGSVYSWISIATLWKKSFLDTDEAVRCMSEAEELAEDTDDWVRIATTWARDFQDTDRAVRCMSEAEELADSSDDYSALEEAWRVGIPSLDPEIRRSGLQRLLDNPDVEDYIDIIEMAIADQSVHREGAVRDLGTLTQSPVSETGTWGEEGQSARREGSYARYYRFTLPQAVEVTIDLTSQVDTYLYLISGDIHSGELLAEDDDGLDNYNSRIRRQLAAGIYSLEATTYHEEEPGVFTLTISWHNR